MAYRFAASAAVFFLLCHAATAQSASRPACFGSRDLASPDGSVTVHVSRGGRFACGESKVEILQSDGHLLLSVDYSSGDGEHGSGLVQAAWSADSRFLVLSLVDAAERGPWVYHMDFYRRDTNKLRPVSTVAPGISVAQPAIKFGDGDLLEIVTENGVSPVHLASR
jgi:hypothetical protein